MSSLVLIAAVGLASLVQESPGSNRRVASELFAQATILTPEGLTEDLWSFPTDVERDDFDGDGHVDLVALGVIRVVVFRGHGNGRFERQRVALDFGGALGAFAHGDVDGDGLPDLIGTPRPDNSGPVRLAHNLGRGSFDPPTVLPVKAGPYADVLLVDVNADGALDALFTSTTNGLVSVLIGNGDGTFAEPLEVPGIGPHGRLASGDLDGDGRPEVVLLADQPARRFSVYQTGPNGLSLPQVVATATSPVTAFRVVDVDGDRRDDIVYSESHPGETAVLLQSAGSGNPVLLALAAPNGQVRECADLDGDGRVDLVLLHPARGTLSIVRARRTGGFAEPIEVPAGPLVTQGTSSHGTTQPVDVVAFPNESRGVLDLAVLNNGGTDSSLALLRGRGDGTFATLDRIALPPGNPRAAIGDLDHDGRNDLALCREGGLSLFTGHGDGSFETGMDVLEPGDLADVAIADLNGDGRPDLVASRSGNTSSQNGLLTFLAQGGGTFGAGSFLRMINHRSNHIAVVDVDRDGVLDVVTGSNIALRFVRGAGDGTLELAPLGGLTTGTTLYDLDVGDADADGQPEVLANVGLFLWLVSYDGSAAPTRRTVGQAIGECAFADLDLDGALDLAGGVGGPRRQRIYWGRGNGTFQPPEVIHGLVDNTTAADLDGDGRLELIQSWDDAFNLAINRQIRPRTFLGLETYAAGAAPSQIVPADLNGDGLLDLVACGPSEDTFSVHLNRSAFPSFRNVGAGRPVDGHPTPWIRGEGAAHPGAAFLVRVGGIPPESIGLLRFLKTGFEHAARSVPDLSQIPLSVDPATLEGHHVLRIPADPTLVGTDYWIDAVFVDSRSHRPLARTGELEVRISHEPLGTDSRTVRARYQ